jgi:hypothetical protein
VTIEVVPRWVDVESFAELLHVFEVQFLVSLLVRSLPVLLRPESFAEIEVTEPAHKGLSYGIQLLKGRIPHLKYVDWRGNDMPNFPATIEGVDDCKPPILALGRYLEQFSVVSSVWGRAQLLDIFYGYCGRKEEMKRMGEELKGDTYWFCAFLIPRWFGLDPDLTW